MMNDLEIYYTPCCRETLELIDYQRRILIDQEKNGEVVDGCKEKLELLDMMREEVLDTARVRQRIDRLENYERKELMHSRLKALCHDCTEYRTVEIIGEKRNEEIDVMCDLVKCKVCGCVFMNPLPNNRDDRREYFRYIEDNCLKLIKEDAKRIRKAEDLNIFLSFLEKARTYNKKQKQIDKRNKDLKEDEKLADEFAYYLRDILAEAKIMGMPWDKLMDLFDDDESGDESFRNN